MKNQGHCFFFQLQTRGTLQPTLTLIQAFRYYLDINWPLGMLTVFFAIGNTGIVNKILYMFFRYYFFVCRAPPLNTWCVIIFLLYYERDSLSLCA